ncbi:MAG TPA: GNAT family N-acetyltransferase, partial [Candidatus Poseidoniaceae archaeon]
MTKLSYFSRPTNEELNESTNLTDIWHQIARLRYEVFAEELHQYPENDAGKLDDPGEHFIVVMRGEILAGYISINTPNESGFRLAKYFGQEIVDEITEEYSDSLLYEVRGLTVHIDHRGHGIARLLMLGALKFSQLNGADEIIAMGHKSVLPMYEDIGMSILSQFDQTAGDVVFYPMIAPVGMLGTSVEEELRELELENVGAIDDACYHGGASWEASGFDFSRRTELVVADVLDSPFPPCPEVMKVISDNLVSACHESPPTHSEPLIKKIAEVRQIQDKNILVSSGSSSLMFSLMPQLLGSQSRVLVLSPMYGEYL